MLRGTPNLPMNSCTNTSATDIAVWFLRAKAFFRSLARVPLHPLLSFLRGPQQVPVPFEHTFYGDQVSPWRRYHTFCTIGLLPPCTPPSKSAASLSAQSCTFPDAHLTDYCARTVVFFASVLGELQFGERVPPQSPYPLRYQTLQRIPSFRRRDSHWAT